MVLPSAPASGDSSSASRSPSPPIELWATSSGTPSPHPLSWRGWDTRLWTLLLSGTTWPHSTAHYGVEQWTSLLRASRVNLGVTPEIEIADVRATNAGSGATSAESSTKSNLDGSSSKTSAGSTTAASKKSSRTSTRAVTRARGANFEHLMLERLKVVRDSSFWPTPCANDAKAHRNKTCRRSNPNSKHHAGETLTDVLYSLPRDPRWAKGRNGQPLLNPRFCEFLMGLPSLWAAPSSSGPSETQFSRWLQRMRSALSHLI